MQTFFYPFPMCPLRCQCVKVRSLACYTFGAGFTFVTEHGITLTEDQFAQAVQDPARNIQFDSSGLVREETSLEQLMVADHVDQDKIITISQ